MALHGVDTSAMVKLGMMADCTLWTISSNGVLMVVMVRVWVWSRQNMGRRYIEVFQAKRVDYYTAIAQTMGGEGQQEARPSGAQAPVPP
jgi:hypothetical protein